MTNDKGVSMDVDPGEVLSYGRAQPKSGWRAWVVAVLCGTAAGVVIGISGYGVLCVGAFLGFAVGAVSARVATSHRLYFGLLAVAICIFTVIGTVAIQMSRFHTFPSLREILMLLFAITPIVGVPGLIASIAISQWRRDK